MPLAFQNNKVKNLLAVRIPATAEISIKLLTCQNKCHKTTLRPILESKGFPKVLTRAADPQFRGRLWSTACSNFWFGISQPWPCSGLNGTGSTSMGEQLTALLINAGAHSELHLEHAAFPWNGKLSEFPSTSLVRCDFHHQWLQSATHNSWGQEREPETCPYVSQGKESVGIFQASRNRRRAIENFWLSTLLMGICTYAQGALPLQMIIKSYWIKMTFTSEHSGALDTRGISNDAVRARLCFLNYSPRQDQLPDKHQRDAYHGDSAASLLWWKISSLKMPTGQEAKTPSPTEFESTVTLAALCQRLISPI